MSTVLGVTCVDGVVLAGDRLVVSDGQVRSQSHPHVFEYDGLGAAVAGDPGDVDEFADRLDAEVRSYRTGHGTLHVGPLAQMASDLAESVDVSAVLAAPDDDGTPRLRSVSPGGGVTEDDLVAFGSGASVVLGVLEADHDPDASLDDAEALARDALSVAAERDAGTGDDVDVYRLSA